VSGLSDVPPEELESIIAEIGRIDTTYPHSTAGSVVGRMCESMGMDYKTFRTAVFERYLG